VHVRLIIGMDLDSPQQSGKMMFLKLRSALLTAFIGALIAGAAQAQAIAPSKVAIINAQKSVADTQEIKKAQAALEAKYRPRQQEIETLQRDLQNIQQQLNSPNLAADRAAQLRADGTHKQKEVQRLSEDLQADVNNERQDILGRAGRQMTDVVKKLAEARGIDIVIDITNTLYFKPGLDITADATAAYDKAYPIK
jgi:outer membrane protein